MKKLSVLALILVMGAAIVYGGGGRQTAQTTGGPQTLTWWGGEILGNDHNTIMNTIEYEKMTGVHINWKLFSSAQTATEAFNLLIASRDLPDIMGIGFTPEQVNMMAEGGIAIPLDNYIWNTDSAYKKALTEQPKYVPMVTAGDGHIYTFIYTDSGVHKDSEYKMWVKVDWLTKLGIAEPTTPDEFANMIRAFMERDPNGNGQRDELPLVGWVNGRQSDPINYLMNPYQLFRENYHYIDDSGNVVFIANTDGWREGIRYLNSLYKAGLIMPETYLQDETQFKNLLNRPSADAIVGVFPGWYQGAFIDQNFLRWNDYQAISPLRGPTGLRQTAARQGGNINLNTVISTACKIPDVAYRLLDYFLSDEGNVFTQFGVEGISYQWVNQPDWNGVTPSILVSPDFNRLNTTMMVWNSGQMPRYDKASVRYSTTANMDRIEADNTYVLVQGAKKYEPYYVWHNVPDIVWCSDQDVLTKRTDYMVMFNDFIKSEYTAFIRGDKDINNNAAWHAYKDELLRLGLNDYIATLQKYYK